MLAVLGFTSSNNLLADTAAHLASAMDVPTSSIVSASYSYIANPDAARTRGSWGASSPFGGTNLAILSTGKAFIPGDAGYAAPSPGTVLGTSGPNPVSGETNCIVEPSTVYDPTELVLVLNVPTNANAFRLKFNFFSADYPEWVCSVVNDRFMIRLTSLGLNGNIAFDSLTNPVSLNTAYFAVASGGDLVGTGMDGGVGGAIGWQTAKAFVTPGETITLKFTIWDEADGTGDSVAVIDDFQWISSEPFNALIYPAVEIGWPSKSNMNYQVEATPVLDTNKWSNLGPVVPGNGTTNYIFDSTRDTMSKFYRVREVP